MAGEIAQDAAIMIALSSAAIGAGGAIVAQVVAGVTTSRREQGRSEAEAERWKLDSDAKRRDRQFDRKIDVFSKFLSVAEAILHLELMPRELTPKEYRPLKAAFRQLRDVTEEIGILSPELYGIAKEVVKEAIAVELIAANRYFRVRFPEADDMGVAAGEKVKGEKVKIGKKDVEETMTMFRFRAWSVLFREATRSYISHEPIRSLQEFVEIHAAMVSSYRKHRVS